MRDKECGGGNETGQERVQQSKHSEQQRRASESGRSERHSALRIHICRELDASVSIAFFVFADIMA